MYGILKDSVLAVARGRIHKPKKFRNPETSAVSISKRKNRVWDEVNNE